MSSKVDSEVLELLLEELQEFFEWMIEELGEEYYMDDPTGPRFSWEAEIHRRLEERMSGGRGRLWERDRYAAFEYQKRPSIYQIVKTNDLEVIHYPQGDLYCEHFKIADAGVGADEEHNFEKRYEDSFGVLLASESLGHMYKLDFCQVCGLIEIWSMVYSPDELALFS